MKTMNIGYNMMNSLQRNNFIKNMEPIYNVSFNNIQINAFLFHKLHNDPKYYYSISEKYLRAIIAVLKILDGHGDCPSVVCIYDNDPELHYKKNGTYKKYATINLAEHTMNTVNEFFDSRDAENIFMREKYLLTLLLHDLGKIPKYYLNHPNVAHPLISSNIIKTIDEMKSLDFSDFDLISNAVSKHHLPSSNAFEKSIKECDNLARFNEIQRYNENNYSIEPLTTDSEKAGAVRGRSYSKLQVSKAKDDIYGWIETNNVMNALAETVNHLLIGDKYWSAIEHDGLVYFKKSAVLHAIEKASYGTAAKLTAYPFVQINIINRVVSELIKARNIVATQYLKLGQSFAKFQYNPDFTKPGDKQIIIELLPVLLHAFGPLQANFTKRKTSAMLNVKELRPL